MTFRFRVERRAAAQIREAAGKTLQVEGAEPNGRIVVIAFPSFAAAKAFEDAPESVAAGEIRRRTAISRIFVVEGSEP